MLDDKASEVPKPDAWAVSFCQGGIVTIQCLRYETRHLTWSYQTPFIVLLQETLARAGGRCAERTSQHMLGCRASSP